MSEPQARREDNEFVVQHEDGTEQRIDMTSVEHRVDAIVYNRYTKRDAPLPDHAAEQLEAAVELAKERKAGA